MRLLIISVAIQMATAQFSLDGISSGGSSSKSMMNMPQVTSLDVQCMKSGMTVDIEFSQPFNGIIFSKGHYSNDACRYVQANSGQTFFKFIIPSGICGSTMTQVPTKPGTSGDRSELSNTIIIQSDPLVQEIWDVARAIRCNWLENLVKTVSFNPFSVGMLDAQEVRFQGDQPIECWMDLQLGAYPTVQDIDNIVKIGDTLSLIVYTRDPNNQYDVSVKDCYAYGGPDYDSPFTPRVQLTDSEGCVIKDKLISPFYMSQEKDKSGSILVTYAYVKAFKFPDVMDVYMSCNMEICKGDCDSKCDIGTTPRGKSIRHGSTLFPATLTTQATTEPQTPSSTTTTQFTVPSSTFKCFPGSNDPRCQQVNPIVCLPGSNHPNCITAPNCFVGSKDPRCFSTTEQPLNCFPGSTDIRCATTPVVPPLSFNCLPGSTSPGCQFQTTPVPPTTISSRRCPGSKDGRCRGSTLFSNTLTTPKPTVPRPTTIPTTQAPLTVAKITTLSATPIRTTQRTTTPSTTRRTTQRPTPQPTTFKPTTSSRVFPIFLSTTRQTAPSTFRPTVPFVTTRLTTPRTTFKPETQRPFSTTSRPILQTTTTKRKGSVLFPESQNLKKTPSPILKPVTKSKGTGKQLVSSQPAPRPEPSGKEWGGDPKYHAFHSYHYQRGDGRRNRIFGKRIQRDLSMIFDETESYRPLIEKKPLRLTRALQVLAPIDLPLNFQDVENNLILNETAEPKELISKYENDTFDFTGGSVCFPLTTITASLLGLLFMIVLTSTVSIVLYIKLKKVTNLKVSEYYWPTN